MANLNINKILLEKLKNKQLTVSLKSDKCQNLIGKIPEYVKVNDKA